MSSITDLPAVPQGEVNLTTRSGSGELFGRSRSQILTATVFRMSRQRACGGR